MSTPVLVITGATGFLGRELVHHLLAADPTTRLALLVRGRDEVHAQARGAEILQARLTGEALTAAQRRVEVVRADLERDGLGLDPATYARLAGRAVGVVHGAGSVRFSLPLAQARAINVEGTRRMLDLARAAGCPVTAAAPRSSRSSTSGRRFTTATSRARAAGPRRHRRARGRDALSPSAPLRAGHRMGQVPPDPAQERRLGRSTLCIVQ